MPAWTIPYTQKVEWNLILTLFLFIFKCRFGRDFGRALWGVGSGLSFLIILGGANGVGCKDVV